MAAIQILNLVRYGVGMIFVSRPALEGMNLFGILFRSLEQKYRFINGSNQGTKNMARCELAFYNTALPFTVELVSYITN